MLGGRLIHLFLSQVDSEPEDKKRRRPLAQSDRLAIWSLAPPLPSLQASGDTLPFYTTLADVRGQLFPKTTAIFHNTPRDMYPWVRNQLKSVLDETLPTLTEQEAEEFRLSPVNSVYGFDNARRVGSVSVTKFFATEETTLSGVLHVFFRARRFSDGTGATALLKFETSDEEGGPLRCFEEVSAESVAITVDGKFSALAYEDSSEVICYTVGADVVGAAGSIVDKVRTLKRLVEIAGRPGFRAIYEHLLHML